MKSLTPPSRPRVSYFPWVLAAGVVVARALTTGPVYFADGPSHIDAIRTGTFLIQPPGYWLFNRMAALFPDPEKGIAWMNWFFSAAGVVVFYYVARMLVPNTLAKLGAAVYSTIFYVWFSGNVHSTYASQLFFPLLVFLFLLLYRGKPRRIYLVAASLIFAVGAGFRPSDGAFMSLVFVFYFIRYVPRRDTIACMAFVTGLCLVWLVPTFWGDPRGNRGIARYIYWAVTHSSMVFQGFSAGSLANLCRFVLPLAVAFWPLVGPLINGARKRGDDRVRLLELWIAPGACFFALLYMSDAPYLNYLTPAVLLLALVGLDHIKIYRSAIYLSICLSWNLVFYLFFTPIPSAALSVNSFNVYTGKYTRYAVESRWQPNLSDVYHRNPPSEK